MRPPRGDEAVAAPGPVTGWVVALDVGGTTMKGAIVGPDGATCGLLRRPTPHDGGPDAVVDAVGTTLGMLLEDARRRGIEAAAAGVVVPGIVDEERGVVVFSANLGWRDLPLRALLAARTGLPVGFGHDVRAARVPRLVLAALGDQAGCLGAALLARRALDAAAPP